MASLPLGAKERESIDRFRRDVLEASLGGVVLVRFTAEWCGPCRQLAPVIERAIAAVGDPRVKQVVIDIDRERLIAEQFRIQSVPTVYGFVGGRPVDGFVGARSEREVKAFIEKLLELLGPDEAELDVEARIEAAMADLAEGRAEAAAQALGGLVREHPDRPDVVGAYARSLVALGRIDGAKAALERMTAEAEHPAIRQARAAIELAENAPDARERAALEARLAADPADHEARFRLAQADLARGQRDRAAEKLLEILKADRNWDGGKARETLLKLIESVGLADPWSVETRRRLRQILYA
ncbi:MAG: tetratricopeptide repeat protein [Sphingomonadaceae bacterium]|uniref:tetratricopeptide repeat protein n=1 Tax=Thermaurantiacus sp. TaxID=2820283 RepID=UPI00298ED364|nr:tetratricopeptide repeat protein [Thermaurantiacus sp.]MCS6987790.1 tetratricopeptide repeat protein [Sphingomonadaceae bacterium]MDW8414990.1 tetratricopeptide repeat protein [Thermaurantiacus sp.]